MCPGNSSICPQPSHKSDFLECNWNSSVCINGSCSGISVCIKFGLESCSCKDKMNECKICCLDGDKCWPAQNITKVCYEGYLCLVWCLVCSVVWCDVM